MPCALVSVYVLQLFLRRRGEPRYWVTSLCVFYLAFGFVTIFAIGAR